MTEGASGDRRRRLRHTLRQIDRRLRLARLLRSLGPGLLAAGVVLFASDILAAAVARDAQAAGSLRALLFATLLVGLGALVLRFLRPGDLRASAALADRRARLDDLLLSAWSLGERRQPVDEEWLALIEQRACEAAETIEPRELAPVRPPRSLVLGAILMIAWAGWLATGGGQLLPEGLLLAQQSRATDEEGSTLAEHAQDAEAPIELEPEPEQLQELLALANRLLGKPIGGLAELRAAEIGELLDDLALARELSEAGTGGQDGEGMEAEGRTQSALEGAERRDLDDRVEDSADPDSDILRELRRDFEEGANTRRGQDVAEKRGEHAPAGELQDRPGDQSNQVSNADAPLQEVDFPLSASSQMRPSDEGQNADSAVAGSPGQSAEAAQQEGGGPQTQNPFGSSTGPQSGPTDPFGRATELEVTLELAILEQQKEKPPPEPAERTRRASPQKAAEVARRSVRARSKTEEERALSVVTTPWRFRELTRKFFAPEEVPAANSATTRDNPSPPPSSPTGA